MRSRTKRRRELDIFNFSFLDILACVIGLLIFVLTIVVVSGGGSSSRQTAGRVSNAEHQLERATEDARISADRRQRDEQMLGQRAQDFANPKGAADAIKAQIRLLESETRELDDSSANADTQLASLNHDLDALAVSGGADPSAVAIQNELRTLDEQTADVLNRASEEQKKTHADIETVHYYVPHLREVHRRTLWVEVSGDRVWCLDSSDYQKVAIDENSTLYNRLPDAPGTSISALAKGDAELPISLSLSPPADTVIEVALDADGYKGFRVLRDWAWSKGFSVNWSPHDGGSITLTRTEHVFEQ
jgi:hypothetical protein